MIFNQEDNLAKPSFNSLVERFLLEGISGGIAGFLIHNRVKLKSEEDRSVLRDFIDLLLAEYPGRDNVKYPFKNSIKSVVDKWIEDESEVLSALYNNNEMDNLAKACHVVSGGAVAQFLEDNREDVLSAIQGLRK